MQVVGSNPFVHMAIKELRAGNVYLDLSSCGLSREDAGILAAELKNTVHLKSLILARNAIPLERRLSPRLAKKIPA